MLLIHAGLIGLRTLSDVSALFGIEQWIPILSWVVTTAGVALLFWYRERIAHARRRMMEVLSPLPGQEVIGKDTSGSSTMDWVVFGGLSVVFVIGGLVVGLVPAAT